MAFAFLSRAAVCAALFLSAFAPLPSSAHQPRIAGDLVVRVEEPGVSKAYYGTLDGEPVTYRIEAEEPFPLYVGILAPDAEGARTDFTVRVERVTADSRELIAALGPTGADWPRWYEKFGADWYLIGPEWPEPYVAEGRDIVGTTVPAGTYEITVSNPGNAGAYSLAVGVEEAFPPAEIARAVWNTPRLDRDFFGAVNPWTALMLPAAAVVAYMLAWYVVSRVRKNRSVADIAWGFGFVLVAWVAAAQFGPRLPEHYVALALVTVWGARLGLHIARRNWNRPEDPRYAGFKYPLVQVFGLQGLLLLLIACAPALIIASPSFAPELLWVRVAGAAAWAVGFVFESVGDAQLAAFLRDPDNKGRVMDRGLWHYTRHPNYFGEATMWWGIWLLAAGSPLWLWLLVSPVTITVLVRYVSGVPMLERRMRGNPAYEAYQARTSVFFPLPPKR